MNLIALSGKAESGKSTVAEYLQNAFQYKAVDMGAIIRDEFKDWKPSQTDPDPVRSTWQDIQLRTNILYTKPTPPDLRVALQYFQDYCLKKDKRHWVRKLTRELRFDANSRIVITNVRLVEEFELVKTLGGQTWRVIRAGHKTEGEWKKHLTEVGLDRAPFDQYVANNHKIPDLYRLVDVLVRGYLL